METNSRVLYKVYNMIIIILATPYHYVIVGITVIK